MDKIEKLKIKYEKRLKEMETKLDAIEEKMNILETDKLKFLADLQNARKRFEKERLELGTRGSLTMLEKLLPFFDNFSLAMKNIPAEKNAWMMGIMSVYKELKKTIQKEGVEIIAEVGVPVDTAIHEVIALDESIPKGEVSEIFQEGYKLKDKVIRPAKVKVGSKKNV